MMKKTLSFVMLGFFASTLIASLDPDLPPPKIPIREPTPVRGFPIDDVTLRGQIFDFIDNIWLSRQTSEDLLLGIQGIAKEGGVTHERMTKMLENIVREGMRELETAEYDSTEYWEAISKVVEPIQMLSVFHGPNTVKLLTDCARFGKAGRTVAMMSYVHIVGAVEAIPLLAEVLIGEIVEKSGKDLNPHRGALFDILQKSAQKLTSEKKDDDALKVYIFFISLAIMECEPNAAAKLDRILCAGLPDYATSFDREKAIGKFADLPMNTDYFKNIRDEIRKVPANKRRDYGKQPLRIPKESEKEIKIMLPPPR